MINDLLSLNLPKKIVAILHPLLVIVFNAETPFFPLLFPKDSQFLKILDIRLWAKRQLNGTSKVNRQTHRRTHRQTDISTYRKHRPRGPMLWKDNIQRFYFPWNLLKLKNQAKITQNKPYFTKITLVWFKVKIYVKTSLTLYKLTSTDYMEK